ncbi:MAG: metallophosphoesterase family protein [Acidobacteriota bacterium]
MRVLHLSDLHVGCGECGARWRDLTERLGRAREALGDPVVVVTGDLVERATEEALLWEAKAGMDRLRSAGYAVLVVPGNHDYGDALRASPEGQAAFGRLFYPDGPEGFPRVDFVGEAVFVGLESMAAELHWYDALWANGELGRAQLERLEDVLGRPQVRSARHRVVYLHHHPFDPMGPLHELKDALGLARVLKENGPLDALLFGHNHAGGAYAGVWGIPRCYDAGTSTRKEGQPGPLRLMDLSEDPSWDVDVRSQLYPDEGI